MRYPISFLALSLASLVACSKDKPPPSPEAAVTAGASAMPATAAPSTSATLSAPQQVLPSAMPSASAAAAPSSNIIRSARPTPMEWCRAPIATLGYEGFDEGESVYACKMIEVREWLMVWCPESGRRSGKNLGRYERALPGGGSMATDAEREAAGVDNIDAVVISLRPGTKANPSFTYRPFGHPEWLKDESFSVELPEDATELSDRIFNARSFPSFEPRDAQRCDELEATAKAEAKARADEKAKEQAAEDAKILPDVDGIAAAPNDEAWAAEKKEVLVTGSGAVGCSTKLIESWFWMRCEGKGKVTGIEIEKGRRQTQTKSSAEEGVGKLLVPYVEGTDLRAKLTVEGVGERFLKLRWPKGKRPFEVGKIGETR